jgi:mRNA interferase RelE/StbE
MPGQKWQLIFNEKASKKFKKLPKEIQKRIIDFFDKRVLISKDPTAYAKALIGELEGFWRFRVGDYRIITSICNHEMIIVAVDLGHRKEIYLLH